MTNQLAPSPPGQDYSQELVDHFTGQTPGAQDYSQELVTHFQTQSHAASFWSSGLAKTLFGTGGAMGVGYALAPLTEGASIPVMAGIGALGFGAGTLARQAIESRVEGTPLNSPQHHRELTQDLLQGAAFGTGVGLVGKAAAALTAEEAGPLAKVLLEHPFLKAATTPGTLAYSMVSAAGGGALAGGVATPPSGTFDVGARVQQAVGTGTASALLGGAIHQTMGMVKAIGGLKSEIETSKTNLRNLHEEEKHVLHEQEKAALFRPTPDGRPPIGQQQATISRDLPILEDRLQTMLRPEAKQFGNEGLTAVTNSAALNYGPWEQAMVHKAGLKTISFKEFFQTGIKTIGSETDPAVSDAIHLVGMTIPLSGEEVASLHQIEQSMVVAKLTNDLPTLNELVKTRRAMIDRLGSQEVAVGKVYDVIKQMNQDMASRILQRDVTPDVADRMAFNTRKVLYANLKEAVPEDLYQGLQHANQWYADTGLPLKRWLYKNFLGSRPDFGTKILEDHLNGTSSRFNKLMLDKLMGTPKEAGLYAYTPNPAAVRLSQEIIGSGQAQRDLALEGQKIRQGLQAKVRFDYGQRIQAGHDQLARLQASANWPKRILSMGFRWAVAYPMFHALVHGLTQEEK